MIHNPVLVKEVLRYLDPKPNENFIDATIGEGGHAIEILKKTSPSGKLLGIDWDENQAENSRINLSEFKERAVIENDSYKNIKEIAIREKFGPVNGILIDLGFSSWHIEESKRGFSFMRDEPLDMRYSGKGNLTAETIVNHYEEDEIGEILSNLGEEKFSKQIARKIIERRKQNSIKSTFELRDIIGQAIPKKLHHGKIHFATRSFQALRIAVNGEIDNLNDFLPNAMDIMDDGGRLVVISFHSLEDRIAKNFFKKLEMQGKAKILTKKPIGAQYEEILINPKSRSAKLRAIMKI